MSTAQPLRRARLGEQLAGHLTDLIVDGTLAPAQPLPTERELARQFSVSVGVVREAIRSLAAIGLVEVRHGVGTFINTRERWNTATPMLLLVRSEPNSVLDVHDLRVPLEMAAVEWAAKRATAADLAGVAATLESMREGLRQPEEFIAADLAFHLALARATHNRILLAVLQPLIEPLQECMLRGFRIPVAAPRALAEHEQIAAAVAGRSVRLARDAMRRHLRTSRDELMSATTAATDAVSARVPTACQPT